MFLSPEARIYTLAPVMRRLAVAAVTALLALGLSGNGIASNHKHDTRIIIDDVEPGGGLWGAIDDGNGPMRYWVRNQATVHLLIQPPTPVVPTDPCRGFIVQWNNTVTNTHLKRTKKFDRFTRILRRFEQWECPIDVGRLPGPEPGGAAIDIAPSE
jgi:hypothetical protein